MEVLEVEAKELPEDAQFKGYQEVIVEAHRVVYREHQIPQREILRACAIGKRI